MVDLIIPSRYRRFLSLSECMNPFDVKCSACTEIELILGTCGALAESPTQENVGLVTAWGMFLCFLIPIVGIATRRTKIFWAGLTPIIAIVLGAILQAIIPGKRPEGACMGSGTSCGMPSGHVITSYATLTFLFCMWGRDVKQKGLRRCLEEVASPLAMVVTFLVIVFLIIQILMPVGRVFIKYHTPEQVGLGVLAGFLIGLAWFLAVLKVIGPNVGPFLQRKLACIHVTDDWNNAGPSQTAWSQGNVDDSPLTAAFEKA